MKTAEDKIKLFLLHSLLLKKLPLKYRAQTINAHLSTGLYKEENGQFYLFDEVSKT